MKRNRTVKKEKVMLWKTFVDEGYLQEVNRQFLHPLGLSMKVFPGQYVGIVDCRNKEGGIRFGEGGLDSKLGADIIGEWNRRARIRMDLYHQVVQTF